MRRLYHSFDKSANYKLKTRSMKKPGISEFAAFPRLFRLLTSACVQLGASIVHANPVAGIEGHFVVLVHFS